MKVYFVHRRLLILLTIFSCGLKTYLCDFFFCLDFEGEEGFTLLTGCGLLVSCILDARLDLGLDSVINMFD